MESPEFTRKYVKAIADAEQNESIRDQFNSIKAEAESELKSLPFGYCGTSFESRFYHKLLNAKLIEPV